jgi:hypothetical protein
MLEIAKNVEPSTEKERIELACNKHSFIAQDESDVNLERNIREKTH